jgi:radical SAM protein with 4Fe4S-binding SPASM domain
MLPLYYLQWHITHACNLRCAHCYQREYKSHMPREKLFQALDQFGELIAGQEVQGQINLTGGEPLLHPDFFPLAEEIRRRGYRLGILTNGTLVDRDMAVRLASLSPVFVQVSLDGTEAVHDSIRGEGSFERAVSGIDALKRSKVKVLVSFTAQKSNAGELAALARFCGRHRVDKLWWDRVVSEDPALYVTTGQFRALVETTNALRKKKWFPGSRRFVSNGRALQFGDAGTDDVYRCSAGQRLLVLLADGSLMPCRRLPFVIGNIREASMKEITEHSELMAELRRPRIPKGCERCPKLPRCGGGSKCVTFARTGELYCRDVNCFYQDRHIPEKECRKSRETPGQPGYTVPAAKEVQE